MEKKFDLVIVGGGASGFFAACNVIKHRPDLSIAILERSKNVLSKVRISGGGRCNFTHDINYTSELLKSYPSGKQLLKKAFKNFTQSDTLKWFNTLGMTYKSEADGRMFPETDNSETVIQILKANSLGKGVNLFTSFLINSIEINELDAVDNYRFCIRSSDMTINAKKLLMAIGGITSKSQRDLLANLNHTLVKSVPSLFTFNVPNNNLSELQGVSVPNAMVRIAGEKLKYEGPLLITHWGFSGPAVLKLSAWGARLLHDKNYNFDILINWDSEVDEVSCRAAISDYLAKHPKRSIIKNNPFTHPSRLWVKFCTISNISPSKNWGEISKKEINRLVECLIRMPFQVSGKTTYKEEFVTSGGIDCAELNTDTMESKLHPNLYFTGEVIDVDGITGGFNFQAAWSTAYTAAKAIAKQEN